MQQTVTAIYHIVGPISYIQKLYFQNSIGSFYELKMPKIDTLDGLEEHEEHEDDYQTNSN